MILKATVQLSSVAQLCPPLCDSMGCSTPGFPVRYHLPEVTQNSCSSSPVMPSNNLILCCPLFLLPSLFASIRVFSNESVLCIRWPKCWSFSFSYSLSYPYMTTGKTIALTRWTSAGKGTEKIKVPDQGVNECKPWQ